MKSTVKSCSCMSCRRGKGTKCHNSLMKNEERSFRHATKSALNKGEEIITSAYCGAWRS